MMATFTPAGARQLRVPVDGLALRGDLAWPEHPSGIVLFAHGSGSSRLSVRNEAVARQLRGAGLATLLFDLLAPSEAERRDTPFQIPLLAGRLRAATEWVSGQPEVTGLPVGYFGASTGAAVALLAASMPGSRVGAVVSCGGRPDLASDALSAVQAPTLLIVGSRDQVVLELNRQAYRRMTGSKRLVVIPGATHLFEEPGRLAAAGDAAMSWLVEHLVLVPRWRTPLTGPVVTGLPETYSFGL